MHLDHNHAADAVRAVEVHGLVGRETSGRISRNCNVWRAAPDRTAGPPRHGEPAAKTTPPNPDFVECGLP